MFNLKSSLFYVKCIAYCVICVTKGICWKCLGLMKVSSFSRFEWDKLLENVHCLIISVTKTDRQDAYILRYFNVQYICKFLWNRLLSRFSDIAFCLNIARFNSCWCLLSKILSICSIVKSFLSNFNTSLLTIIGVFLKLVTKIIFIRAGDLPYTVL